MLEDSLDTGVQIQVVLYRIWMITRLQKAVLGLEDLIAGQVLPSIDHLQFITRTQDAGLNIAAIESIFGRQGYPVDRGRQKMRAISLDSDSHAEDLFKLLHQLLIDKEGRFSTSQDEPGRRG